YRSKDELGHAVSPYLIPELSPFVSSGQSVTLAFDADLQAQTRKRVALAIARFGGLLAQAECQVTVASWRPEQGKGIDDLLVASGAGVVDTALAEALSLADWRIAQRLLGQLTLKPDLQIKTADLSTITPEGLPESGIIGLSSAKGTGKTKFIGQHIQEQEQVVGLSHRICLIRNQCERMGLHYRGDLDKHEGRFITGSAYTLRIGSCVDSLLAFDPAQFEGCNLIIDEVVQVLRHLLTSATCRKDGKLPALLNRFTQLLQVAQRVLVADADLNNAVLEYLQSFRPDDEAIFLIRNDYTPEGYPIRFIEAKNDSALFADLSQALAAGRKAFIATDSLKRSKVLASFCERLGINPLVINSETSGGEIEQAFIRNPNANVTAYQVVIASPSLATGVSIETSYFEAVYGFFYGASSTDADIAQALGRVREPVPRLVWCAKQGRGVSRDHDALNPLLLKSYLQQRAETSKQLLEDELDFDAQQAFNKIDWTGDPHLNLWAKLEAERNVSLRDLRNQLRVRLLLEGHNLQVEDLEDCATTHNLTKELRQQIKQAEAIAIVQARVLRASEVKLLEQQEAQKPEDRLALKRFHLCDFYAIPPESLTVEIVLDDRDGRYRWELLNLEAQLYPHLARQRDLGAIAAQLRWQKGLVPWNLSHAELQRQVLEKLGLNTLLDPDKEWTAQCLAEIAKKLRQNAEAVHVALNYTISHKVSDTQIVHELLLRLGLKVTFRWSRVFPGQEGEKVRVYRLQPNRWQANRAIIQRRLEKYTASGSPPTSIETLKQADPTPNQKKVQEVKAWVSYQGWWYWCDRVENEQAILLESANSPEAELIKVPWSVVQGENAA
ncbi:MAG: plasmid replication protein, CyRepA1 family, partial [Cyanobacteria bacterium P01_H01_bin.121]